MPLTPSTAQKLLALVPLLREAKERIPRAEWTRRPSPDTFSLVDQVCHLRDLEEEGYILRIRRLLREDAPALSDFDGAAVAAARDYRRQELGEALAAFDRARRQNVALLSDLPPEAFRRHGRLGDLGEVTLERLVELMVEHDASHREELAALLTSLGR